MSVDNINVHFFELLCCNSKIIDKYVNFIRESIVHRIPIMIDEDQVFVRGTIKGKAYHVLISFHDDENSSGCRNSWTFTDQIDGEPTIYKTFMKYYKSSPQTRQLLHALCEERIDELDEFDEQNRDD